MRLSPLLLVLALAQEQEPQARFGTTTEVLLRSVRVVAKPRVDGAPPLTAADLEVREDGRDVDVVALDRLGTTGWSRLEGAAASPVQAPSAVDQVLYLDMATLRLRSPRTVADWMRPLVPRLLDRGPVTIVTADPDPAVLVAAARTTGELERALETLRDRPGRDRLVEIRQAQPPTRQTETGPGWVPLPEREENAVIARSMRTLLDFVSGRPGGILYFATDGFDLANTLYSRPSVFGSSRIGAADRAPTAPVAPREQDPEGNRQVVLRTASAVAAQGWIVVAIGPGHDQDWAGGSGGATEGNVKHSETGDPESVVRPRYGLMFKRPSEPLLMIADATGGEVATAPDRLAGAVERLQELWLVTFRPRKARDGQFHEIAVNTRRPDWEIRAAKFAAAGTSEDVAAWRVRQMLENGEETNPVLPVTVTLEPTKKGATARISVDLATILPILRQHGGRIRMTVAVREGTAIPVPYHEEHRLGGSALDAGRWQDTASIRWPAGATRLAILIEELTTGATGGRVMSIARE